MNDVATIGHNTGSILDAQQQSTIDNLADDAKAKAHEFEALEAMGEIEDEAAAQQINEFIVSARGLKKTIEESRKTEKQGFLGMCRAIDDGFKAVFVPLDIVLASAKKLHTAWLQKEAARIAERIRQAQELERQTQLEAAEKVRIAEEEGSAAAAIEAKAAQDAVNLAASRADAAGKVKAQTVGAGRASGLRTTRRLEIVDVGKVFRRYRSHPDMEELLIKLATAEWRAMKKEIPGTQIVETQTV